MSQKPARQPNPFRRTGVVSRVGRIRWLGDRVVAAHLALAVAVLAQAVDDAAAGDDDAKEFLMSPQVGSILTQLGLPDEYCRRLFCRRSTFPASLKGKWLTVSEAAVFAHCAPETIRHRIRTGRLLARGGGQGRVWLVCADSLAALPPGRSAPPPKEPSNG